jgi:cytochrome c5
MKYLLIIMMIVLIACNRTAMPVITSRKTEPSVPAKPVLSVYPDIETGKIIFTNRCGKCHGLPKPEDFTAKRWEGILSYMIPKARINNEQGIHVIAYLKANAQK